MKAITHVQKDGKTVYTCRTVGQAEAWIAKREKHDPKGVHAGRYTIDPNMEAYRRWHEGANRRRLRKELRQY